MTWVKVKKTKVQRNEPSVTVSSDRFSFNSCFSKLGELIKNSFVNFYCDEENRKIGFEFKKDSDSNDDYRVIAARYCKNSELLNKPWIRKIAQMKEKLVFAAKKEGKKWVITLCPAFEIAVKRNEYNKIPEAAKGIYRYIKGDEVVYIGKGNIRERLNEKQRIEWKFDLIEYSEIEDSEEALSWEDYWIGKYKSSHDFELPLYNIISGHSQEK